MSAETLLARLDMVRPNGKHKWMARCPAHDDGRPSLSIRESESGKVLLWCFAGCSAEDVARAAGLSLSDLFPDKEHDYPKAIRQSFNARDVLLAARFELLLTAVAASNMANGQTLTREDRERLLLASRRLERAANAVEPIFRRTEGV